MSRSYQDRTVVVVGGSAGLGFAIARAFARQRSRLVIVARGPSKLASAVKQIQEDFAVSATSVAADVTVEDEVAAAFATIRKGHEGVDVLVNAVGVSDRSTVFDVTPAKLQAHWEINVLSAVQCTRAAADDLVSRRGQVINIGSLASKIVAPYLGCYPITKFALAAYTHQLRIELKSRGVDVLLVCPGPIQRDDAGHRYDAQAQDLPESARRPGGGAKLRALDPHRLANKIVDAARAGRAELVVPAKVSWLAALAQLAPAWADRIVRGQTSDPGRQP